MTRVIDKFLSRNTNERDYTIERYEPFAMEHSIEFIREESYMVYPKEIHELEGRIRVRFTCSPYNKEEEEKRAKSYLKRILYADVLTAIDKIALLVAEGKRTESLKFIDDLVDSLSTFRETR